MEIFITDAEYFGSSDKSVESLAAGRTTRNEMLPALSTSDLDPLDMNQMGIRSSVHEGRAAGV
jgi:hypothetical protein